MTGWMLDTLVWTGALITLVLVLRRPVAARFGARAAYALWLLPFARMLLPPIELPAWLAPATEPAAMQAVFVIPGDAAMAAPAAPMEVPFDWAGLLLAIWLVGAVLLLLRRFVIYSRMRRVLLADAVPVGRAGRIRLVETPVAPSPVAFGVVDKVIALPPGFMAWPDRTARDLALAHELAHHRGYDLLANFAVQPLFALHWFNPLGWLGWAALRRDQEAACDARVVEQCDRPGRAAYAALIAGLAAGPDLALAAPMACPVLGEKNIIQRLRSLTMTDISPRRRLLGRALVAGGLLVLPLTASISYAEGADAPIAPTAPLAPAAPIAPVAPVAPGTPAMPLWLQAAGEAETEAPADGDKVERKVMIFRHKDGEHAEGDPEVIVNEDRKVIVIDGKGMSEEERARLRAELKENMREMEGELAEARKEHRLAMMEMRRELGGDLTRIKVDCKDAAGKDGWQQKDGKKVMILCHSDITASAVAGLRAARDQIARDGTMSGDVRAEVLKALDEQIAKMSRSAD